MDERIRAGFSYDVDGTINRSRFGGLLSLLVPPPKSALLDQLKISSPVS